MEGWGGGIKCVSFRRRWGSNDDVSTTLSPIVFPVQYREYEYDVFSKVNVIPFRTTQFASNKNE